MLMPMLMAAVAAAGDASPGLVMPGAAPMDAGTVEVGATGAAFISFVGYGAMGFGLEAAAAPTDALAVSGLMLMETSYTTPHGAAASARYRFGSERFGVAPTVSVLGATDPVGSFVVAGVAFDGGDDRVRGDLTLTPVTYSLTNDDVAWFPAPLVLTEAGISMFVSEHDRVRIGLAASMPAVSLRHEQSSIYVDVALATLGFYSVAKVSLGARF
jgi:hypothetical protein